MNEYIFDPLNRFATSAPFCSSTSEEQSFGSICAKPSLEARSTGGTTTAGGASSAGFSAADGLLVFGWFTVVSSGFFLQAVKANAAASGSAMMVDFGFIDQIKKV